MIAQNDASAPVASRLPWAGRIFDWAVDLIFPPHCVSCHHTGEWLCSECIDQIEPIGPPVCPRCGMPQRSSRTSAPVQETTNEPMCVDCRRKPPQLDGLRSYAFHGGPLRTAIHRLKYEDMRVLAGPLATLMGQAWCAHYDAEVHVDAVIPVPLHSRRERDRGYNQAALLARDLAIGIGYPVINDALARTRFTAPQVDLSAEQRQSNVQGAFHADRGRIAGGSILLVDDVLTSGATLEACCSALRDAGATSVWAYTLARARSNGRTDPQ